jgi:putative membrane protein
MRFIINLNNKQHSSLIKINSMSNMNDPTASTEKEFREKVIGPANLSLLTSQLAVDKATNINTREFANFELGEAKAVTEVLTDLGTVVPEMDDKATETFEKIKQAEAGEEFDMIYVSAQLENHEFLRDLAMDYLSNTDGSSVEENQGKHLATLSLAVFKEHVEITKRIKMELENWEN